MVTMDAPPASTLQTKTDGPTFIDLFAGSGGLTLGLKRAGWKPLAAVDNWPDAIATHQANLGSEHVVLEADVSSLDSEQLVRAAGERPDWIVGGPPCKGFSTIGKRNRNDPRNSLVFYFARLVEEIKPSYVLIENVLGLRDMRFVDSVVERFEEIGYSMTSVVFSAAEFGVPQLRRRIFFVGSIFPARFSPPQVSLPPKDYVSVWEAIGDLPSLKPGESVERYSSEPFSEFQKAMRGNSKKLHGHVASKHPSELVEAISYIPDGGNRSSIPDRLQPRSGFHNSYSRLDSKAPAVAVTQNMGKPSGTRCIHPFQDRGLTAREGARLQTFPDSYVFCGGLTSQRLQIANAVPPKLAEGVARLLMDESCWINDLAKGVVSCDVVSRTGSQQQLALL